MRNRVVTVILSLIMAGYTGEAAVADHSITELSQIPVYTGHCIAQGKGSNSGIFTIWSYYMCNTSDYLTYGGDASSSWNTKLKVYSSTMGLTDLLELDRIVRLTSIGPLYSSGKDEIDLDNVGEYILVEQVGGRVTIFNVLNDGTLTEILNVICYRTEYLNVINIPGTESIAILIPFDNIVSLSNPKYDLLPAAEVKSELSQDQLVLIDIEKLQYSPDRAIEYSRLTMSSSFIQK